MTVIHRLLTVLGRSAGRWRHVLRSQRCIIEQLGNVLLAYALTWPIFTREYCCYCEDLFRKAFSRLSGPLNVSFGNYAIIFPNLSRTVRLGIQNEHTLLKPGGRDSAGAWQGSIPLGKGDGSYLVPIPDYDHLRKFDYFIECSIPSLLKIKECGVLQSYLARTVQIDIRTDHWKGIFE